LFLIIASCFALSSVSGSKPIAVLSRGNKGLDHLGLNEVTVEAVQLVEPEIVAVEVRVRCIVWIAAQVTEVLHQHKGAVEFLVGEMFVLDHGGQYCRP